MAKKRKKKGPAPARRKSEFGGGLGDQLKRLKLGKVKEPDPFAAALAQAKDAQPPVEAAEDCAEAVPSAVPLTDEEAFVQALESMERVDVYQGKYGDANDDWRPDFYKRPSVDSVDQPELSDEEAREKVETLRDMKMLELSLGGMDSLMTNSKYHVPQAHVVRRAESPFSTPLLSKHDADLDQITLDATQKELMRRFDKYEKRVRAIELNVRGDTEEHALRRVELTITTCVKRRDKYLRLIHGKGLNSVGEPILKHAILAWIEGPGRSKISGFSPVVDRDGGFGALIIELRLP